MNPPQKKVKVDRKLLRRYMEKVSVTTPDLCWSWLGTKNSRGYGRFWLAGKMELAHRVAILIASGQEVPLTRTVDHLCKRKLCVNPTHLEVVTIRENILRSNGIGARNARKTVCKNGHPFSKENTYTFKKSKGTFRQCKTCWKATIKKQRSTYTP